MNEVATDCWITPPDQVERVHQLFRGPPDLDPFHDPASTVGATLALDCREGWDAYRDDWPEFETAFINGPYSGDHPRRTARRVHRYARPGRVLLNLCPAAPGSDYWRAHVWPRVNAIAWLGRLAFVAGRDMRDRHGKISFRAGQVVHGNRTEIAMLYTGERPDRFSRIWDRWEVTILRRTIAP